MTKRAVPDALDDNDYSLSRHLSKKLCVHDGLLDRQVHRQSPKRAKVARGDTAGTIDIIFRGLDLNANVEEFDTVSKSRKRRPSSIAVDTFTVDADSARDESECGARMGMDTEQQAELVVRTASGSRAFQITARSVAQLIETLRGGSFSASPLRLPAGLDRLEASLPPECLQLSRRSPPFLPWLLREAIAGLRTQTARIFVASRCGKVWQVQVPNGAGFHSVQSTTVTPGAGDSEVALPEHALARGQLPCVLREVSEPDASLLEALRSTQACATPDPPVVPRLPASLSATGLNWIGAPASRPSALRGNVDADGDRDMEGCQ